MDLLVAVSLPIMPLTLVEKALYLIYLIDEELGCFPSKLRAFIRLKFWLAIF